MPELTPEQKKMMEIRAARGKRVAEGKPSEPETEPVALEVMLESGNQIEIGDHLYTVRAFSLKNKAEATRLITQCPDMYVAAAQAGADGIELTAEALVERFNRLIRMTQTDSPQELSADTISLMFANAETTDEHVDAMTSLAVLALRRAHPNITADDLDLDVPSFIKLLTVVFRVNDPIAQRF